MRTNINTDTARTRYHLRQRPRTVTRGLPHYVIGQDYRRLLALVRMYDHMQRWRGYDARRLIEYQCERLHRRVYGETCYYGALPPELYAYGSPYI
jgi:ATP-dependent protease Clp ATPase subunit